nr:reverse transcriptase domain-containing protein [Tanacetum cinerariifolium]
MSQGYREPVTYTSVYTDSEPWRYYGEESAKAGSLRVILYGYAGLPMQQIPYVPESEYPKYLVPSNAEEPLEDQPLPADASPTAASPGYVADYDSDKDSEEDPEDDHVDYPTDGGDSDDEPSDDDEDEEPFEDEEDDEEEEEHLVPTDSSVVPIVDPVLPVGDTKALEANEPAPTPRSPHTIIPLSHTRLRTARKTIRLEPPMSASMEACIARHAALLSPPLPIPYPPLPFPSPLTTSPTNTGAPLSYRAADIRMRALLPSISPRTDIPEADMPPRKRACFTTLAPGFKVRESSVASAVRQPGPTESDLRRGRVEQTGYGITDTWDEIVDTLMEIASTTLEGDNRAFLRARVNTLFRDRPDHCRTAMLLDREAIYAHEAWSGSEDRSEAIAAYVRTLEAYVVALIAQTSSLQTQLTTALGRVAAALAECDADMRRNGDNNNDSGTGGFEKNDHNCPRGEIQKLESEYWNLKVKGRPAATNNNTNNNNQRAQGANARGITCFECGVQRHYKSDCPKLKNGNQENRARNRNAMARAYAVGTAKTNPNSNVVTGTFLLNNHNASILFNTGADRSFISTAFSSLMYIIPTMLDHGYDVELADGRIIWVNTLIRGCTLNFLNHPFNINLMHVEMGSFDVIIEAQQAADGPTSLGATCEEGAHPQLSSGYGLSAPSDSISSKQDMDKGTKNYSFDHIFSGSNLSVLVDKTKSAGDRLTTTHTDLGTNKESRADDISKKIKLKDLSEFLKDIRSVFFTLDSSQDDPIIVTDESEEEDADKEDTPDTSHNMPKDTSLPPPSSLKSDQIQDLMAQVQLLKSSKDELEQ